MCTSNMDFQSRRMFCFGDRALGVCAVLGATALCLMSFITFAFSQSASNSLPEGVAEMRDAIIDAAKSGKLEAMGIPIELNELSPDFGGVPALMPDPLDRLAALAPNGDAQAMLKSLVSILSLPHRQIESVFVWPYLARRSDGPLTEVERADLKAIAGDDELSTVWVRARYVGFRIEIGADGTWQYLGRALP